MSDPIELGCLVLGGRQVVCHLVRVAARKRWALDVQAPGELTLRAPPRATPQQALALLQRHRAWVEDRLEKAAALPRNLPPRAGATISYLGGSLTLQPMSGPTGRGWLADDILYLAVPSPLEADLALALTHWYRQEARRLLPPRLRQWADLLGVTHQRLTIRGQSSRWGSCSATGGINLNWKLVHLPWPLIDYVLVHELCHLRHMNHSPAFWAEVARHLPDYATRRHQLRMRECGG